MQSTGGGAPGQWHRRMWVLAWRTMRQFAGVTADEKLSEMAGLVLTHPMAGPLFTKSSGDRATLGNLRNYRLGQPRPCDPQPIGESSSNMAQNSTSFGRRPVCMSWPSDTSPSSGRDTRPNRARRRSMNA